MDSITAQLALRDLLRDYLTDPYTLFVPSQSARDGSYWIFADEPNSSSKYPKIEVLKGIDGLNEVIGMGSPYSDMEMNYFNVFFYVKNGTSITVSGTTYKNSQVCEYYSGLIKSTVKSHFSDIVSSDGIKDVVPVASPRPTYDPNTQLYYTYITFRVRFFNINC